MIRSSHAAADSSVCLRSLCAADDGAGAAGLAASRRASAPAWSIGGAGAAVPATGCSERSFERFVGSGAGDAGKAAGAF